MWASDCPSVWMHLLQDGLDTGDPRKVEVDAVGQFVEHREKLPAVAAAGRGMVMVGFWSGRGLRRKLVQGFTVTVTVAARNPVGVVRMVTDSSGAGSLSSAAAL
ncbi:MAG: hypothetical protein JWM59_2451 [Verrucomicrobiales bacterium]|nr:hypothetical protein [Verrucomicrobiales bacterium]